VTLLQVDGIVVRYGNITAIHGVSFRVSQGEIVTLIGANGAGKTTSLKSIMGVLKPAQGSIKFLDQEITGRQTVDLVEQGLSLVPEGRQVFTSLTVMENLDMGRYLRRDKEGVAQDLKGVFDLFPVLAERSEQLAGTLSGGEQQMLAIGRALMARPKLLLLDEPSMGLSPILVVQIFDLIKRINQTGTTILLVEQNASLALKTSDRGYVLETGRVVLEGPTQELTANAKVREAYLG